MPYDPEQTKLRIVQASAELFYGQSIAEVGVDAIAERAGITKKTLYYHFDNKTNLVRESFAHRARYVLGQCASILAEASSAEKGIVSLFESVGSFARLSTTKGCPFVRGAAELAAKDDHPAIGVIRDYKKALAGLISASLEREGYDRPDQLARQIMVIYEGAITNIMFHNDPNYVEDAIAASQVVLSRSKCGL